MQRHIFGGRGLNPRPCIYYALSLTTELSSQEQACKDIAIQTMVSTKLGPKSLNRRLQHTLKVTLIKKENRRNINEIHIKRH